jgi:quercetin dioxygenase-like cupin family protein
VETLRRRVAPIEAAEIVLPGEPLADTVAFFVDELGFAIETVFPADDPRWITVVGHGLRIRFDRDVVGPPGRVRMHSGAQTVGDEPTAIAPNGTQVEIVAADPPVVAPPLSPRFAVARLTSEASWVTGRAGMQYRDLIEGRLGGRFIASHIRIPAGGPVPDWVHYHRVQGQLIYCARGWVRVVYEDQGPPFVMQEGDCVLQPPRIRHRVLESSAGLEVIELSVPADHETWADPTLTLPNTEAPRPREFSGQRFVHHIASGAAWAPWRGAGSGFEARDLELAAASAGVVDGRVVRAVAGAAASRPRWRADAELSLLVVLHGQTTIEVEGHETTVLRRGDALVVPPGSDCRVVDRSDDLRLLELSSSAGSARSPV